MKNDSVIITGASGFIGGQLCKSISDSYGKISRIIAIDKVFPERHLTNSHGIDVNFQTIDMTLEIPNSIFRDASVIFHLAANPDVRIGATDTSIDFSNNIVATRNLLEHLKAVKFHGSLVFASSSTVYGDASLIPTPETYGPLIPISMYGASKLACESLICAYANLFGFNAKIVRFANIVGVGSKHGIVSDFIRKLRTNANRLEVLGDGTQVKSYVHISDCVDGLLMVSETGADVDVFNLGSQGTTSVRKVADLVIEELGLDNVYIETGHGTGVDGRGWPGDVKVMLLDCSKLSKIGWNCRFTSDEAISRSARELARVP